MKLTIVPIADRVLAILFLVIAFFAAMAERPMEASLWAFSGLLFFCACYQQARAEHYKKLSERAEQIFETQLSDGKDHSACQCKRVS
jgi:hypothetical protein